MALCTRQKKFIQKKILLNAGRRTSLINLKEEGAKSTIEKIVSKTYHNQPPLQDSYRFWIEHLIEAKPFALSGN